MGPPGSGKGTQAKIIAAKLEIPHISTGDIFRTAMKEDPTISDLISRGMLVPDDVTNRIVFKRLNGSDCGKGFILDGYPRTINQAEALDTYLEENGLKIDCVIDLMVSSETILKRVKSRMLCATCGTSYNTVTNPPKKAGVCNNCGHLLSTRDDDDEQTVIDRIDVYEKNTKALIDYYAKCGNLCEIPGEESVEQATKSIGVCLGKDF